MYKWSNAVIFTDADADDTDDDPDDDDGDEGYMNTTHAMLYLHAKPALLGPNEGFSTF